MINSIYYFSGNGTIDFQEFLSMMARQKKNPVDEELELRESFKVRETKLI